MTGQNAPNRTGTGTETGTANKLTFRNSFHNTQIAIRCKVGDTLSSKTGRRVWRTLCGMKNCECSSGSDGTRDSRYFLVREGYDTSAPFLVQENEFVAEECK